MKKYFIILLFMFLAVFASCEKKENEKENDKEDEQEEVVEDDFSNSGLPELIDEELYEKLFDINSFVSFYIDIDASELSKIQADYERYSAMGSKSPIYRKCDLIITVNDYKYKFEEVGIRMKGNTSRRNFYSETEGIYDMIHYKLSFQETFDDDEYGDDKKVWESDEARKERKNRLFAGMEKLDLKWNKSYDATHVREIYAYELYRNFGIVAPHATLCKVEIKNLGEKQSLGVFNLFESIDEIFLERYFENSTGDLYKIGWGKTSDGNYSGGTLLENTNHPNSIGKEDEDKCYFPIYDIKTNKKTTDHSSLKNLITNVNNGNFDGVDIEQFIKFMAVSYLIGNPDDFRTHYNNFYIYFDNSKMILIPYDYDRCLGITKEWNPLNAMTGIDPNSLYTTELGENVNPIIKKVLSDNSLKEKYNDYLIEFSESEMYTFVKFNSYFEAYKKTYKNEVIPTLEKVKDKYIKFDTIESDQTNRNDVNYSIGKYISAIKKEIFKLK